MATRSAKRLFAQLDDVAKANSFSGVVSVRLGAELEFDRAYGYADRANAIENTMRTRFGTASVTKGFTALAVCALIEEGELTLETPATEVLGELLPDLSPEMTIEHLLTHTSGVGDYYDEDVVTDFTDFHLPIPWFRLERPRDYLPLIADLPAQFPPGERFSYSNSGYVLLGVIVEELTGVPFQRFVEARIFDPAGMSESGFFRFDQLPESTALGYIEASDGSWRTNVYNLPVVGGPDGGAFSTAADMARFWSSLHADRILGREWRERWLRPRISAPSPSLFYGLGVWIHQRPDGQAIPFLQGEDAGVTFSSLHDASSETGYTVACNSPPGATEVVKLLDGELAGHAFT